MFASVSCFSKMATSLIRKMTNLLFGLVGVQLASGNTVDAPFLCALPQSFLMRQQHQRCSHVSKIMCGVGRAHMPCSDPVKERCLRVHHLCSNSHLHGDPAVIVMEI